MKLEYKLFKKKSTIHNYVSNLNDIVLVKYSATMDEIEDYKVSCKSSLTDEFQIINNVEIIIRNKRILKKLLELNKNQSLVVYVKEFNDKYLFELN